MHLGLMALDIRSPRGAERVVDDLRGAFREHGIDVPVRRWDGVELGPDDVGWRLVLEHPGSLRSLLLPPTDLNAGEAYVFGDVDVEGSMVAALRSVAALRDADLSTADPAALASKLRRLPRSNRADAGRVFRGRGRIHSTRRDSAAVRFHYDAGNDFYRLFLDRGMVYSCAYFDEADRDAPLSDDQLDRAQERKLDLICRKLHLQPGERLLDIGCGWGSLLLHAGQRYGVRGLGVTLSPPQAELAAERIAGAGLADRRGQGPRLPGNRRVVRRRRVGRHVRARRDPSSWRPTSTASSSSPLPGDGSSTTASPPDGGGLSASWPKIRTRSSAATCSPTVPWRRPTSRSG